MALSLPTNYQQATIWGLALAILVLVSLRAVEAFMCSCSGIFCLRRSALEMEQAFNFLSVHNFFKGIQPITTQLLQ